MRHLEFFFIAQNPLAELQWHYSICVTFGGKLPQVEKITTDIICCIMSRASHCATDDVCGNILTSDSLPPKGM